MQPAWLGPWLLEVGFNLDAWPIAAAQVDQHVLIHSDIFGQSVEHIWGVSMFSSIMNSFNSFHRSFVDDMHAWYFCCNPAGSPWADFILLPIALYKARLLAMGISAWDIALIRFFSASLIGSALGIASANALAYQPQVHLRQATLIVLPFGEALMHGLACHGAIDERSEMLKANCQVTYMQIPPAPVIHFHPSRNNWFHCHTRYVCHIEMLS